MHEVCRFLSMPVSVCPKPKNASSYCVMYIWYKTPQTSLSQNSTLHPLPIPTPGSLTTAQLDFTPLPLWNLISTSLSPTPSSKTLTTLFPIQLPGAPTITIFSTRTAAIVLRNSLLFLSFAAFPATSTERKVSDAKVNERWMNAPS